MPIKYAIEQKTPDELLEMETLYSGFPAAHSRAKNPFTYLEVPEDVAVNDLEFGRSALFNIDDFQLSPWLPRSEKAQELIAKIKQREPLRDAMGTMLANDDYVIASFGSANDFIICQVVGFSENSIRIHNLSTNKVSTRDPKLLVKLDTSII